MAVGPTGAAELAAWMHELDGMGWTQATFLLAVAAAAAVVYTTLRHWLLRGEGSAPAHAGQTGGSLPSDPLRMSYDDATKTWTVRRYADVVALAGHPSVAANFIPAL